MTNAFYAFFDRHVTVCLEILLFVITYDKRTPKLNIYIPLTGFNYGLLGVAFSVYNTLYSQIHQKHTEKLCTPVLQARTRTLALPLLHIVISYTIINTHQILYESSCC